MGKTHEQRVIVYKAANRIRNRDIRKHQRAVTTALMVSVMPLIDRIGRVEQFNEGMLSLVNEDALTEAIKNIYLTTGKSFAKASEKALTKMGKKEFADFSFEQKVQQILKDNTNGGLGMLIVQMNDYTKKLIAAEIDLLIKQGLPYSEMGVILQSKFRDINRVRGIRIARTEVVKASNFGALEGALQSGVPFVKEWNSVLDSRVRGLHGAADGKQAKQDEAFRIGSDRLLHPADTSLGASAKNVINCRCVIDFVPLDEYEAGKDTAINNVELPPEIPDFDSMDTPF
jgi:hypothetical protein